MMLSKLVVSPVIEEYLEQIYRLENEHGVVRTKQLADLIGVSLGTVTNTIESLEKKNFVVHKPYKGVKLTDNGRRIAKDVIRRHRLIECLLADFLKLDWSVLHKKACGLEHYISGDLIKPLEKALGHPKTCPHGNPIPTACGALQEESQPLLDLHEREKGIVIKIINETQDLLKYLMSINLIPGVIIEVIEKAPFNGPLMLKVKGQNRSISREVASFIWVRKKKDE